MSEPYPYIQTLRDFEQGIEAYAIQPVNEDNTPNPAEENPILAFGPLGHINIFVGATNAGKSRFLRALAKCESYQFMLKEVHQQMRIMLELCDWFSHSSGSLTLSINQKGSYYPDGTPVAFEHMPKWVPGALPGLKAKEDYEVTFDSLYFQNTQRILNSFFQERFLDQQKRGKDHFEGLNTIEALWLRNLIKGENEAKAKDQSKNLSTLYNPDRLDSIENRLREFGVKGRIQWAYRDAPDEWEAKFLVFWDAFEYLRQTDNVAPQKPPARFYIPVLRSAVSLRDEEGKRLTYDIFEQTVRRNYKLEESSLQIFSGNRLYDTLRRDRNGTPEVVSRLRDFETFLGEAFYEGRRVEIVALDEAFEAGQHINVRVQNETPRELHDLGDGINTLVILLYQLFMAEPHSWVFIEEPELNLHPGLQRVFLQTLLQNAALKKRQLRIFFTTHSNHLLRMTLRDGTIAASDISIFAFQQRASDKDRFLIRPLVSEHHEALALLGVQNASVLLAHCGLWVEGVTDRRYLRAYLGAYQNSAEFKGNKLPTMREDTHFAFWEYAGSNLSHYLMRAIPRKGTLQAEEFERGRKGVMAEIESSALCNRIFLMADRDESKTRKHQDLEALAQARRNFQYYVTSAIEIENLLSPEQLTACLPKLLLKAKLSRVAFNQADYKNVRMGTFLRRLFPADFKSEWCADSGTLATPRKNRLCELAVAHISWDNMSQEARALAKALHRFISKHNSI